MSEKVDAITVRALLMLGIYPNTKGFRYLRRAVSLYISGRESRAQSSAQLYKEVAKPFETTGGAVERSIRHAIQSGWHRRNRRFADMVFYALLQGQNDVPSNTLFISALGEYVGRESVISSK